MRHPMPKVGDVIHGQTIVQIDDHYTQYKEYRKRYCTIQCQNKHEPRRYILSALLSTGTKKWGCHQCANDIRRELVFCMPDGARIGYKQLKARWPTGDVIVAEVRETQRTRRAARKPTDALPINARARALIADGMSREAAAQCLDMTVEELSCILRS